MSKIPERRAYLIGKANEAYEVQCLLMGIKLGLAASGLHLEDYQVLLSAAIQKLKFIGGALSSEANSGR